MSTRNFFAGLGLTTLITALVFGAAAFFLPDLQGRPGFLLLCIAVFMALCTVVYYSARPAANSSNKARLAQYVMILTFVKMAISLGLVYGYFIWAKPQGQVFLIPFFVSYLTYTIFETSYLLKLNKATAAVKPDSK